MLLSACIVTLLLTLISCDYYPSLILIYYGSIIEEVGFQIMSAYPKS